MRETEAQKEQEKAEIESRYKKYEEGTTFRYFLVK